MKESKALIGSLMETLERINKKREGRELAVEKWHLIKEYILMLSKKRENKASVENHAFLFIYEMAGVKGK